MWDWRSCDACVGILPGSGASPRDEGWVTEATGRFPILPGADQRHHWRQHGTSTASTSTQALGLESATEVGVHGTVGRFVAGVHLR